jgi:hypothetical protein
VADPGPPEAFRDFEERYSHIPGIRSIESGDYEHGPCLVAMVEEGFGSDRLPAAFMGFPVLLDDGVRAYEATGDLI